MGRDLGDFLLVALPAHPARPAPPPQDSALPAEWAMAIPSVLAFAPLILAAVPGPATGALATGATWHVDSGGYPRLHVLEFLIAIVPSAVLMKSASLAYRLHVSIPDLLGTCKCRLARRVIYLTTAAVASLIFALILCYEAIRLSRALSASTVQDMLTALEVAYQADRSAMVSLDGSGARSALDALSAYVKSQTDVCVRAVRLGSAPVAVSCGGTRPGPAWDVVVQETLPSGDVFAVTLDHTGESRRLAATPGFRGHVA